MRHCVIVLLAVSCLGLSAVSQTADELVQKNIEAKGGLEKIKAIKTLRATGRLVAGGGFKHGQHLAFNTDHNYPLPNLFVSMLERLGLGVDRFASSTGTMRGLELA